MDLEKYEAYLVAAHRFDDAVLSLMWKHARPDDTGDGYIAYLEQELDSAREALRRARRT